MKSFIFDLDGVIVHTDKFHYKAWKKVADRTGIYFDEEINNRLRGISRAASLEVILEKCDKDLSPEEKLALMREKNNAYREFLSTMTSADVTAEVRETLQMLRKSGHKLAIGSSSKNAGFILEKVKLKNMFDAISDGNNISHSKPDPEVFIKAAEYIKDAAENCIVVEDAHAGIDAAKSAQMTAVGIGDAFRYDKADYRISSFNQLLELTCI